MPIYEYECSLCDNRFEKKQRFDDEPVTECPNCQGRVRRIIHSAPIIFKGSGFYITDSRKGGATGSEEGGSGKKDKAEAPSKGGGIGKKDKVEAPGEGGEKAKEAA